MYIVTNVSKIEKGEAYKLIDRFDKVGQVETMKGFLGLEVLSGEKIEDYDEVAVVTRWDSEEAFLGWMESDAFKAAHQYKGGKPEYIMSNRISYQQVKITRDPIVAVS